MTRRMSGRAEKDCKGKTDKIIKEATRIKNITNAKIISRDPMYDLTYLRGMRDAAQMILAEAERVANDDG